jgi:hypothetical protein
VAYTNPALTSSYAQQGYVTPPQSAPPAAAAPSYPAGYGQYGAPAQPTAFAQAMAPEMAAMAAQVPPQVEAWLASLPEEQRAASRAAYLAQAQGQQSAPTPTGPGI